MAFLRHSCTSIRWVLVVLGSILFLSIYLPRTWSGETNLVEYSKTMKDLDKNMHEVKKKYKISGIIAGMDAQVEVKPNQEPLVGSGTRMSRGNTSSRACSWSGSRSTRSSWRIFSAKVGNPQEQRPTHWISGSRKRNSWKSGKSLIMLQFPFNGDEEQCG